MEVARFAAHDPLEPHIMAYSVPPSVRSSMQMSQKRESMPLFPPGSFFPMDTRRLSTIGSDTIKSWRMEDAWEDRDDATEIDMDFEDDSSDFEDEELFEVPFSNMNEGRRSRSTISTFEEVATPAGNRLSDSSLLFEARQSIEGPVGPHLFRASTMSSEFDFDCALQLSPVVPKGSDTSNVLLFSQPLHTGSTLKTFPRANPATEARSQVTIGNEDDPGSWSANRVATWMAQCGIDDETCKKFVAQDVTGEVLLSMSLDQLKEVDNRSFGKRHLLWVYICELRAEFNYTSCASELETTLIRASSRRRRNKFDTHDLITPAESASMVAIEQLLPKCQLCASEMTCTHHTAQQRLLRRIQGNVGMSATPAFPVNGNQVGVPFGTDLDQAMATPNTAIHIPHSFDAQRPFSDAMPSIVASSDLLGPGQQPRLAALLQEELLQDVVSRDPQENVMNFLTLQHIEPPQAIPITPIDDPPALDMFPPIPTVTPFVGHGPSPLTGLKALPKLSIPRSATTGPQQQRSNALTPSAAAASRTPITTSPAFPIGPDAAREMTRSVPPNMHYRDPASHSASASTLRRPSPLFALPTLGEHEVLNTAFPASSSASSFTLVSALSRSRTSLATPLANKPTTPATTASASAAATYGEGVQHAGWMRKRRTRFLVRREWAEHHFRLAGTRLAMHGTSLPSSSPIDCLDIDDYAVACSGVAGSTVSSRLGQRIRGMGRGGKEGGVREKGFDPASFRFELVPAERAERSAAAAAAAAGSGRRGTGGAKLVKLAPGSGRPTTCSPKSAQSGARSASLGNGGSATAGGRVGAGASRAATRRAGGGGGGKTHHFAVHSRDERIDWMRELMLAKALRAKAREGYAVQRIGEEQDEDDAKTNGGAKVITHG